MEDLTYWEIEQDDFENALEDNCCAFFDRLNTLAGRMYAWSADETVKNHNEKNERLKKTLCKLEQSKKSFLCRMF